MTTMKIDRTTGPRHALNRRVNLILEKMMLALIRSKEKGLSFMFHRYREGTFWTFGLWLPIELRYQNQATIEMGGEFMDSILFSEIATMLDIDIGLSKGHFSFKRHSRRWSHRYDLITRLFGEKERFVELDSDDSTPHHYTTKQGYRYLLTPAYNYEKRPRLKKQTVLHKGYMVTPVKNEQGESFDIGDPTIIIANQGALDELVDLIRGLRGNLNESATYFKDKEQE